MCLDFSFSLMKIEGEHVLPYGYLVRQRMCRALLAKPVSFAATFLAQGASLSPMAVASAMIDGALMLSTSDFGFETPAGVSLTWGDAARVVRAHRRAYGPVERRMFNKCCTAYLAKCAEKKERLHQMRAEYIVRFNRAMAKKISGFFERPPKPSANVLRQREVWAQKFTHLAHDLQRKKALKRQRQQSVVEFQTPEVTPLKTCQVSWTTEGPVPRDGTLGALSHPAACYERAVKFVAEFSQATHELFPQMSFSGDWKHVPGLLVQYRLALAFEQAYKVMPTSSLVEDTLFALREGGGMVAFNRAYATAQQVVDIFAGNSSTNAHGFTDYMRKCGNYVKSTLCSTVEAIGESFFAPLVRQMKRLFYDCLGQYLPHIVEVKEQIENFWRHAVKWVQNICGALDCTLKVLQGSAVIACAIVFIGGITYFVESLLQSLGVISATANGTLLGLFLGSVIMWFCGFRVGVTGPMLEMRAAMIRMAQALFQKPRDSMNASLTAHSIGSVFGVPCAVVEALGTGLVRTSADFLHYGSRWGAAVDNIRKGVVTMRQFLGGLLEHITFLYDKVTGKQAAFFRELTSLVYVDVEKWVKDCQEFLLTAEILPEGDRVVMDTTLELLEKGNTIQRVLCEHTPATRGVSFNYGQLVAGLIRRLNDVYKIAQKCGRKALYRKVPFWVYFYGEAGCGKTLFSQTFVNALTAHLGTTSDNVYSKNSRDQYWSKYRQQRVVIVDDLSATEGQPSLESEFIQLVSVTPYALNMAAVDEKGAEFNSDVIVTTSNVFTAPTMAKITDKAAYNRRRHAVVQVQRKPDSKYDPAQPCASSQARLVERQDQAPLSEWVSMEEMSAILLDKQVQHERDQQAEYLYWKRSAGNTHDVFDAIKMNLDRDAFVFSYDSSLLPPSLGSDPRQRYIVVDENIIEFSPATMAGEIKKIPPPKEGEAKVDWGSLEKHGDTWYPDLAAMLQGWQCNGIARQFVAQLLQGPTHVDSIKSLNVEASASHKEFFGTMGLVERAILRLMQKRIDALRKDPVHVQCNDFQMRGIASYFKEGYDYVAENSGKIFLVFAALILVFFFASTCINLVKAIFIGGGAISAGAAVERLHTHSTIPSSSMADSYSSRNMRRVYRPSSLTLHSSGGVQDVKDKEYALHALVRLTLSDGRIISAMRFKSRSIALTYHQALTIAPGSLVSIAYTNNQGVSQTPISHYWEPSEDHLLRFSDTEICVYKHPQLSALPAAMQGLFVKDVELLPRMLNFNGCVVKMAGESAQFVGEVKNANEPILHMFGGIISLNTTALTIDNYQWGGDYSKMIPKSWTGNYPSFKEDCGAILVAKLQDGYKIVGMHVAGTRCADGSFVSSAALLPAWNCMADAHSGPSTLQLEAGRDTPGVKKVGWIAAKDIPRAPRKTQYQWVDKEYRVPTDEPIKEPAILSGDDPRLSMDHKGYDPLRNATNKCEQPMLEMDSQILHEVATEMVERWYDCNPQLSNLSDFEMINGNDEEQFVDAVVHNTSEGYPYVLERQPGDKGKERYLEQVPDAPEGHKRLKEGTSVHRDFLALQKSIYCEVPQLWCMEIPKDERLPRRKIDNPKTRTFTVLPMPYNLLLRKYTGRFMAFLQGNRHRLASAVGVNPYSAEWTRLYDRLAAKSPMALNGDYASFDGLMNFQMYDIIARMINRCYRDDDHATARYNLIVAMCGRFSICGSQVYELVAGMPSGCAMTVIINSIFNEILIRYVWKRSISGIPRNQFHLHVALVVYGDDNLIAVKPEFYSGTLSGYDEKGMPLTINQFDGPTIQKELAALKVKITDGSDKLAAEFHQKPLGSLDFLKRGFKRMGDGRVLAPLDKSAIFSSLHVVVPEQGSTIMAVWKNAAVALRELYLHQDEQLFHYVRNFYLEKGEMWAQLPTWRECRDFHQHQYSGWQPWAPHKFIEIPLPSTNLQFMKNQGGKTTMCIVADQVCVVGEGWKNPDPSMYFVVDLVHKSTRDEHTLCVSPVCGEGAGRLPTEAWVASVRSPKNGWFTTVSSLRKQGKIICFRDMAPYITGWAVALSFCIGNGMNIKDILPMYKLSGGQHPGMVENYFKNKVYIELSTTIDPWTRRSKG
ncbi:polyprotein [Stenotaphrum nepovirus]|uniref:RNA1 polyprotein n=6 Tax=Stenotaphrum nepovirus TaxID=2875798 RepID=A0AAX2ZAC9_9SECO|nr:polyprotein [Stenotaphrum nepovirus]UAT87937.1 polyprotein [Stenotaphrum nepovirus]